MKVEQGQSLLDVAIQYGGDLSALFELAQNNVLSITEDLKLGSELIDVEPVKGKLVQYFAERGYIPATAVRLRSPIVEEGIGYWALGVDFVVD